MELPLEFAALVGTELAIALVVAANARLLLRRHLAPAIVVALDVLALVGTELLVPLIVAERLAAFLG